MDRAELLAQLFDQLMNGREILEVECFEDDRTPPAGFLFAHRAGELIAFAPRDRDAPVAGGCELARDAETQPATATGHDDVLLHYRRANLPDGATSRLGTKRSMVGTLYGASARRQLSRISVLSCWPSALALIGEPDLTTTSATTSAPVIGLLRALTSDICTLGCRLITASTSSGWTLRPPTLMMPSRRPTK